MATGKLTQLPAPEGCLAATGDGVTCKSVVALDAPRSLALSKNGKHLYVAAQTSDSVAIFQRSKTTGALTQLAAPNGCVQLNGDGVTCSAAIGLDDPMSLAVSGRNVYVVSYASDALAIFDRHTASGALTQLPAPHGCHDEVGDGVTCTDAVALNGARSVTMSKDGRHIFVATGLSDGVAAFGRDKATGEVEQLYFPNACTTHTGDNVFCRPGLGLLSARGITVTKDGKNVYVASYNSDAVAVFRRKK